LVGPLPIEAIKGQRHRAKLAQNPNMEIPNCVPNRFLSNIVSQLKMDKEKKQVKER
jgi:hypothetical protein